MPRLAVIGGSFAALIACHPAPPASPPEVRDAWIRPGKTAGSTAAYLTIANASDADVRLTAVASEVGQASLHRSSTDNGIARMRPVETLTVPANGTVVLRPGADHVMVMGLSRDLSVGERVALRLTFDRGGVVETTAVVANGEGEWHGGH